MEYRFVQSGSCYWVELRETDPARAVHQKTRVEKTAEQSNSDRGTETKGANKKRHSPHARPGDPNSGVTRQSRPEGQNQTDPHCLVRVCPRESRPEGCIAEAHCQLR